MGTKRHFRDMVLKSTHNNQQNKGLSLFAKMHFPVISRNKVSNLIFISCHWIAALISSGEAREQSLSAGKGDIIPLI